MIEEVMSIRTKYIDGLNKLAYGAKYTTHMNAFISYPGGDFQNLLSEIMDACIKIDIVKFDHINSINNK